MIYIIRHGQTIWNLEKRKQGHNDSPLTLKGLEQAQHVCNLLEGESLNFDEYQILVSPLARARQYAQIIVETLGLPQPTVEPLIKEHGFGAWEGLTQPEVDERFPGSTEERTANRWEYIIPGGGESYKIISARSEEFLRKYGRENNIIMICHEMISKVTRGHLMGLSNDETLALGHPQDTIYKYASNQLTELK